MLEIALIWLYVYLTSVAVGKTALGLSGYDFSEKKVAGNVLFSLCGLTVITVCAGYFSLFSKTGLAFNLILTAYTIFYWIRKKKFSFLPFSFSGNKKDASFYIRIIFLVAALLLILVKAAGPINNPDTGAYHLPSLKWIENYKVIKGIANVHSRFGFNYQYLVLCAVYSFSFLNIASAHAMNGYLMLMSVLYIIGSLDYYRERKLSQQDFIKLIVLFFIINMNNAISSLSPDFPTTVMVITAIFLIVKKIVAKTTYQLDDDAKMIFIISIGALLFKISSIPVFLFSLLFIIPLLKKKFKTFLFLVFIGIIAVTPYLIRNYFISGYLVYPLYKLDIFNVPWKVPKSIIIYEKEVIRSFALGLEYGKPYPPAKELLQSWWSYLKNANSAYPYIIMLLAVCVIMNVSYLIYSFTLRKTGQTKEWFFLSVIFFICLAYWWLNAPDPRFGNGFIVPFIAITVSFFSGFFRKKFPVFIINGLLIMLSVLCGMMIEGNALSSVPNSYNKTSYNFITQEAYMRPDTIRHSTLQRPLYFTADSTFCWDACVPCSYSYDKYKYMGKKTEDGFMPVHD